MKPAFRVDVKVLTIKQIREKVQAYQKLFDVEPTNLYIGDAVLDDNNGGVWLIHGKSAVIKKITNKRIYIQLVDEVEIVKVKLPANGAKLSLS